MIFRYLLSGIFLIILISVSGCSSLFRVDLTVVGEKTALERQVLGTYQELGRDLTVYASVRGVQPDGSLEEPPPTTESQREVLQAINNRRYNRDDLNVLLTSGVVGEANDGSLEVLNRDQLQDEDITPDLMNQVIEEENSDRALIIDRLMKTTPGVQENQREEVAWIFAKLNQELAPSGSRIQQQNGEWVTK